MISQEFPIQRGGVDRDTDQAGVAFAAHELDHAAVCRDRHLVPIVVAVSRGQRDLVQAPGHLHLNIDVAGPASFDGIPVLLASAAFAFACARYDARSNRGQNRVLGRQP